MLADKEPDTIANVGKAFANIPCNFEFAVSVNMAQIQKHMDEATDKGFAAWCNQDASTAIIYGAGLVNQDDFTERMTWLRNINVTDDAAVVHLMGKEGETMVTLK